MKDDLIRRCDEELTVLRDRHLKRELSAIEGIDFTSNDFLGLSHHEQIRRAVEHALKDGIALGAGGSRLLRGNHDVHQQLEQEAAAFFGCGKSLFFSSGYSANFALLTTLPKKQDLIVFDALSHASIREGVFTTQATGVKVAHNNPDAIDRVIANWHADRASSSVAWIVVESLYSMDGDQAPLGELVRIAERHNAMLLVDEAHATGLFGDGGCGLTEPWQGHDNLIVLHTCGKALGAAGALICAPSTLIDYMVTRCRPFIYSTAPSPLIAVAVRAALRTIASHPELRQELKQRADFANHELKRRFGVRGSGSQIIPFIIGDESLTTQIAGQMQQAGFDLRAIRPPTVPTGTSRLRISITLNVTEDEISQMFDTLYRIMKQLNATPIEI